MRYNGAASGKTRKRAAKATDWRFWYRLQWGRVWEDAETYCHDSEHVIGYLLQWGRVWEDAETVPYILKPEQDE